MEEFDDRRTVVLVGHSFIRRLGIFTENSPDHVNLKLNKHRFNVILRAKGGLKVPELANSRNLLDFSDLVTEDNICFMQIGGNDISNVHVAPNDVARQIMSLAHFLIETNKFSHVVIGQLLRRHPRKVGREYNSKVIDTNKLLHDECQHTNNIIFWHHHGFWDDDMKYLADDGVHLKDSQQDHQFMNKYLQSIKSAVLHASHLTKQTTIQR